MEDLKRIAQELRSGQSIAPISTRDFLWLFGAQRRGYGIVQSIREELRTAGIRTFPDFETTFIDEPIGFELDAETAPKKSNVLDRPLIENSTTGSETAELTRSDPIFRISKLAAAKQDVVRVDPESKLSEAITIMMSRDFSQLPIMSGIREVKGIITWQSIGSKLALKQQDELYVKNFMEPHRDIRNNASLFDAIPIIAEYQYVLVRSYDNSIVGIVTASDLSYTFQSLAEPFLLLSEIENMIRSIIASRFRPEELSAAKDPRDSEREVRGPQDLAFGEYIRLLENPDSWEKMNISVDRKTFCEGLKEVKRIRNDVMHFDADGVRPKDIDKLREYTKFIQKINAVI